MRERRSAPFIAPLQGKARAAGLWNLALPGLAADEPGTRMSNLEFAPCAEIMGRLQCGSQAFNCHEPEAPNMALPLVCGRYGLVNVCYGQTRPDEQPIETSR